MRRASRILPILLVLPLVAHAQHSAQGTEADAYTRYELLEPGSAKFKITYEVTATTPGAAYYFNPIRKGSIATDESVFDRATGQPLPFTEVGAAEASAGGVRVSDSTQRYIRVALPRPVPAADGESRAGTSTYLNVVRPGSTVSRPSARNLDTGEPLVAEVLKGEAITRAKLDVSDVTPASEVVVFRFPPVPMGGSTRIRMAETYTDPVRYRLVGDELVWDRSFGRPLNIVVLPPGWVLTNSSVPSVVSTRPDGRVQLDFVNPRDDEIAVLITARRR